MKLNYPKINSFINLSNKVDLTLLIFNRLILIIKSKTYRNECLKPSVANKKYQVLEKIIIRL